MREIPVFKDTRLLEALDYIDRDLIAEVVNDIKAPDVDEIPSQNKKAVWRSVKYALLFAACLVLLGAVIPVVTYLSQNLDIFAAGIFGHSTSEATESQDNNAEQESNAHYPMFTPDLEPISDDTVAELKAVWYKMVYDAEYEAYSKFYELQSNLYKEQMESACILTAENNANEYASILFSTKKEDHFRGRYYGTISDCVIFAINTYLVDEYNIITLGQTSIVNDYSFHIFAYKDGVIKTVETAYSDGWLNATDAEKIKERHNKFNTYGYWKFDEPKEYTYAKFVSDLEEISDKKIEQINNVLFRDRYEKELILFATKNPEIQKIYSNRRAKEIYARQSYYPAKATSNAFVVGTKTMEHFINSFRYYGTFGNCVIWAEVGDTEAVTEYDLDGIKLFFSNGAVIRVYRNGKIYDLQDAFANGILDIDNAHKLYHRYLTYEAYLVSDRSAPILAFSENTPMEEVYAETKKGGFVVFNDAFIAAGDEIWNSFYDKCSQGTPAEINIVNYYPSRSAIFLTTIVYNGDQFVQYTEARRGGYTNFLYSKYKHIIKYDGEPLDKESAIHRREEVYILVNDQTLTYQKIKESTESINYYIAFTKLSDIKDEYTHLIPTE